MRGMACEQASRKLVAGDNDSVQIGVRWDIMWLAAYVAAPAAVIRHAPAASCPGTRCRG